MAQASIEARRILDATMFRAPTLKLLQAIACAVALACLAPLAQAEFRQDMTLAEVETEVAAQTTAGRSAQDIAGEALGAGLEPGMVTTAMINAGIAPLVAIGAAINNGAPREAVRAGAIAAGVPIHEAVAMIVYWLPEVKGKEYGYSLATSSDPSPDLGSSGGSGSGPIASPN
jgi:hypothetical protein